MTSYNLTCTIARDTSAAVAAGEEACTDAQAACGPPMICACHRRSHEPIERWVLERCVLESLPSQYLAVLQPALLERSCVLRTLAST